MLRRITRDSAIENAQAKLNRTLRLCLPHVVRHNIGHRGDNSDQTIHTAGPDSLWATPGDWNAFGIYTPMKPLNITVEINTTPKGFGFFARDDLFREVYLMHTGRLGARTGITREKFVRWMSLQGVERVDVFCGNDSAKAYLVGRIGDPRLHLQVWRYVRNVQMFKDKVTGSPPVKMVAPVSVLTELAELRAKDAAREAQMEALQAWHSRGRGLLHTPPLDTSN